MAVLLGRQSAGTTADSQLTGFTAVWRFQASASGELAVIFAQTKLANSGVTGVTLGIYSDSAGEPNTLLANHAVDSLAAAQGTGTFQATLSSTVTINSGTFYWLGWRAVGETWDWQGDSSGAYKEAGVDWQTPWPTVGDSDGIVNAIIWGEDSGGIPPKAGAGIIGP